MVKQNAGRCLQVAVSTYDKKSFLGIKYGKQGTGHPTLPLCIPAEYNRTVSIRAELAYSVTSQIEIALSPRRFGWGNDSCEERKNYSHTEDWGAEIPPGYRIVRVHESNPDIRNQTGIGVSYQATSATAAGWLDDASCFEGPFGIAKFFHDTHWYMTLTPTIAGPKTNQHSSSATAGPVPMAPEHTRVCAMVPKEAAATGSSTFSIVLTQYVQGEPLPAPLYQGPLKTAPDASEFAYDDKVPGYEIGSTYNPTVVNGLSQICATVKSTAACGW